jgi:hypothetical protein
MTHNTVANSSVNYILYDNIIYFRLLLLNLHLLLLSDETVCQATAQLLLLVFLLIIIPEFKTLEVSLLSVNDLQKKKLNIYIITTYETWILLYMNCHEIHQTAVFLSVPTQYLKFKSILKLMF